MNTALSIVSLCFLVVALVAIYFALTKVRQEIIEHQEKLASELSEVRKLLEKKADKA